MKKKKHIVLKNRGGFNEEIYFGQRYQLCFLQYIFFHLTFKLSKFSRIFSHSKGHYSMTPGLRHHFTHLSCPQKRTVPQYGRH